MLSLAYFYGDKKFAGRYPQDYFTSDLQSHLPVWHLVGGKDLLTDAEHTGSEPDDGYPVTLEEWIEADGLFCLKIKLTGNDREWDLNRLINVGAIGAKYNVKHYSLELILKIGYNRMFNVNSAFCSLYKHFKDIDTFSFMNLQKF